VLRGARRAPRLRALLGWAGLFVAVVAPYWAWRWHYYGYPFPNSYYAKAGASLYVAGLGGDFMVLYRFLGPRLPRLALALQEGLATLWSRAVAAWPSA